jgi:hypothetical protein
MRVLKQFGASLKVVLQEISGNIVTQLLQRRKKKLLTFNHLDINQSMENHGWAATRIQATEIFLT